jgi:hypothetical protein
VAREKNLGKKCACDIGVRAKEYISRMYFLSLQWKMVDGFS